MQNSIQMDSVDIIVGRNTRNISNNLFEFLNVSKIELGSFSKQSSSESPINKYLHFKSLKSMNCVDSCDDSQSWE